MVKFVVDAGDKNNEEFYFPRKNVILNIFSKKLNYYGFEQILLCRGFRDFVCPSRLDYSLSRIFLDFYVIILFSTGILCNVLDGRLDNCA